MTLALLWFILIGCALFLHVGLAGIDLGVCLLSLSGDRKRAESMVATIDSVWHTSQTWLVVLGALLFGAFPKLYGAALSSGYGLVVVLLLALGVRGLGLEYRHRALHPGPWLRLAGWGALAISAAEGIFLGTLCLGGENPSPWFGLGAVIHPQFFPAMLLMVFIGLLMGGSWLLGDPRWRGESGPVRLLTVIGSLGVVLTGLLFCVQITQASPAWMSIPWNPLIILTVVGLADLVILFASLRGTWQGSPLPWGLTLVAVVVAAAGVLIYESIGHRLGELAQHDLTFMTIAACVILPPLMAFQIFQFRLERRPEKPAQNIPAEPGEEM